MTSKMKHAAELELMQAALDNVLVNGERRRLEEHLMACADCYALWQALNGVERLLSNPPQAAAPASFTRRFQARLARQRSRVRPVWGGLVLGVAAAIALAVTALALLESAARLLTAAADGALLTALWVGFRAAVSFGETILTAAFVVVRLAGGWLVAQPLAWFMAMAGVIMVGVWLYLVRRMVWNGNIHWRYG